MQGSGFRVWGSRVSKFQVEAMKNEAGSLGFKAFSREFVRSERSHQKTTHTPKSVKDP